MGPFAVEASTACPCWVISMRPAATRRRAAARAGSMSGSQSSRAGSAGGVATRGARGFGGADGFVAAALLEEF